MPANQYRPDQPEFYDAPYKYDNLSHILGGSCVFNSEEEKTAAFASPENYRAFATSRLPQKPSSAENIQRVIEIIPKLKVDEKLHEQRRRLSEQARKAILDVAVNKVAASTC